MVGRTKLAVLGLEGSLSILILLCIPSLGGGSLSVENGGGDFLRGVGSGELGLAIVSPLPGEWVNHKAFSVVLEVWSLERADFEVKVWLNEREVYNATAAPDDSWSGWQLRYPASYIPRSSSWPILNSSATTTTSSSPPPTSTSPTLYITNTVLLMQLPDIPTSSTSMSVRAEASMRAGSSSNGQASSTKVAIASSDANIFSSWGAALSTLKDDPSLAMMLVTRIRRSQGNGIWPPPALVLRWPRHGSCVSPMGFEASFALLGGGGEDGEEKGAVVVARLDGEVIETLEPWSMSLSVGPIPGGGEQRGGGREGKGDGKGGGVKHCLTLSHETSVNNAVVAAPVGACFTTSCGDDGGAGESSGDHFLEEEARGRVLLATWMPPRHHTTGMAERLWQVVSRLVESGFQVLVASQGCSADGLEPPAEQYDDPRVSIISCGFELTQTEVSSILLRHPVEHIIVASWWFQHPRFRGLPEVWMPEVRDYAESASLSILVDDLFEPELEEINRHLQESESHLSGVCGAQTLAFAGADAIGTLTGEDAEALAAYLPPGGVPVTRVRYTTSSRDEFVVPTRGPGSIAGVGAGEGEGGRLVYVGSCHEANTAALTWLIDSVLPHIEKLLGGGRGWHLRVAGDVSQCSLGEGVCKDGDCGARREDGIRVVFLGYVQDLAQEIRTSTVYLSPRLSGLGLSTKLMLGLENGVPSVTTPHGIRGYNITALDGTQGVLLAPPDDPRLFAEQVHRLIVDRDLWGVASRGGARHVGEQFSTDLQREDVLRLLQFAKEHRGRAV